MSDMYRTAYYGIQQVLDNHLGPTEEDGAGEGIVADVLMAIVKAEKRGASEVLRALADEWAVDYPGHSQVLLSRAHGIESGEEDL